MVDFRRFKQLLHHRGITWGNKVFIEVGFYEVEEFNHGSISVFARFMID